MITTITFCIQECHKKKNFHKKSNGFSAKLKAPTVTTITSHSRMSTEENFLEM